MQYPTNSIQYIMPKKYLPEFEKVRLQNLQTAYDTYVKSSSVALIAQRKKLQEIEIAKCIRGIPLIFNAEEIANAATKKLQSHKNLTNDISALYSQVNNIAESMGTNTRSVIQSLCSLLVIQQGLVPSGSTLSMDMAFAKQLAGKARNLSSYLSIGKFASLLGDLGETTSAIMETEVINQIVNEMINKLRSGHGLSGKTTKVRYSGNMANQGNRSINHKTVQTDNRASVYFDISSMGDIVLGVENPVAKLRKTFHFSDKANKKLATLNSTKRRTTGQLSFRSQKIGALIQELNLAQETTNYIYDIISYHRSGSDLITIMPGEAGHLVRKFFAQKLLNDMFLLEGDLNRVDFTIYGNQVFAESEVYDTLTGSSASGETARMATINYYDLQKMKGTSQPGKTSHERLVAGTTAATERIKNISAVLKASLALKK